MSFNLVERKLTTYVPHRLSQRLKTSQYAPVRSIYFAALKPSVEILVISGRTMRKNVTHEIEQFAVTENAFTVYRSEDVCGNLALCRWQLSAEGCNDRQGHPKSPRQVNSRGHHLLGGIGGHASDCAGELTDFCAYYTEHGAVKRHAAVKGILPLLHRTHHNCCL